jgi:hypothetical protein
MMNMQTLRSGRSALLLVSLVTLLALGWAAHALTIVPTKVVGMIVIRTPIRGCETVREVTSTIGLGLSLTMDRQGHLRVYLEPTSAISGRNGLQHEKLVSMVVHPLAVGDTTFLFDTYVTPYLSGMVVTRVNLPCLQ